MMPRVAALRGVDAWLAAGATGARAFLEAELGARERDPHDALEVQAWREAEAALQALHAGDAQAARARVQAAQRAVESWQPTLSVTRRLQAALEAHARGRSLTLEEREHLQHYEAGLLRVLRGAPRPP